ncbi:NAD-dependent epimerase/dehydratase family protein [Candidatus Bathyarchaeota archaeon]|nr:NAD-dependent epimerase/dehydratase family protein [Candidatus Bathyarchaeota archaeon]
MKALVTGGAGFIGSHIVDYLISKGEPVRVVDNLSSGSMSNLSQWIGNESFEFIEGDLLDQIFMNEVVKGCDHVFHLAANPEVNVKKASPEDHFKQNIEATYNLLEAMRKDGGQDFIVFTSTSTVYGEADQIPTMEDYGPLKPISMYGASKLACEGLLSAYASMNGFKSVIFRLANVVGPRSNHGVIYDFVKKLEADPSTLEVLGDGSQSKSYLYVDDCVAGIMNGVQSSEQVAIYNIGSQDRTNVLKIAEIVKDEMGVTDADIKLTGGVDGGRGWKGDVKIMQLDMGMLCGTGWSPRFNSDEAVKLTARSLIKTLS